MAFWLSLAKTGSGLRQELTITTTVNKLSEAEQLLGLFQYIFIFALYKFPRSN